MFKFLKDKLKSAISRFTKKVDEESVEVQEEVTEEVKEEPKEILEEKKEEPKKEEEKPIEVKPAEPKKVEKPVEKKVEPAKEEVKKPAEPEVKEPPKEEPVKQEPKIEEQPKKEEKKSIFSRVKEHFKKEEPKISEVKVVEEETTQLHKPVEIKLGEEETKEEKKEDKSIFKKFSEIITTRVISESKFDDIFWELEVALMENNVAYQVIKKIKGDLKKNLVDSRVKSGKTEAIIQSTLKESIRGLFDIESIDVISKIKEKSDPYVICFFGVNGSGKTTTIAKFARLLKDHGLSVVLAASDTFRAAAINQLEVHAKNVDVKVIKQDYNSDPAAVAYDAIEHAKSKKKDVVLIDTAGRSHSNTNLMDELKKVVRVAKPDLRIFVGDSLTGNDAVEQANTFEKAVGIDAIILTKVDVDEKGGAAISISYVTKKPILYVGIGQEYEDLQEFDSSIVVKTLGLEV